MKKVITLLLLIFTAFACVQLKSKPLRSSESSHDGFYYALPKTFINIEFTLKETKTTKGRYSKYAECLGYEEKEIEKFSKPKAYTIEKVDITNNVYLDKDEIYQLDVNQKFLNKSNFKLEYSKNGELTSGELTNESHVIPTIITVANVVSDIAGGNSFLSPNKETKDGSSCEKLPDYITNELKQLSDIDTAILRLLNGGPDGLSQKQLEYRLKELKTLKSNIVSKFTATVTTKTLKYSFELDPKAISNSCLLFRYSPKDGFLRVDKSNPHDTNMPINDKMPFYYKSDGTETTKAVAIELVYIDNTYSNSVAKRIVTHNINKTKTEEEATDNKKAINNKNEISNSIVKKEYKEQEGSFYYRIPAIAKYKIMQDGKNLGEATLPIPQMGITLAAPKKLKNINFKLHPGLGSIYTVSGKTDSMRFGEIDSLRKTIFTDKNANKIKILKEAIEIRNLEKELSGESNTIDDDLEGASEENDN